MPLPLRDFGSQEFDNRSVELLGDFFVREMADARKLDQLTILKVARKNPPGGGIDSSIARAPDE
jgi:hypothetical protein